MLMALAGVGGIRGLGKPGIQRLTSSRVRSYSLGPEPVRLAGMIMMSWHIQTFFDCFLPSMCMG